ncbi:erythrocyte band 7 integral membrane protein-like [Tropilaelaps mercedesae]|uniref:Erythrocyte band 7 integral membrane protein-like n=1 Tax=Tropilaelaps mercedesae TaxID=418985 RepID=A0A1V9XYJ1_9ACAR|nr:erythrocyte band 7 integral membrane protein-like [Tropilaelaps mercedesae]
MYGRRLSVLSVLPPSTRRSSRQGDQRSDSIAEGSASDSQASEHLQPEEPTTSRPASRRSSKRHSKAPALSGQTAVPGGGARAPSPATPIQQAPPVLMAAPRPFPDPPEGPPLTDAQLLETRLLEKKLKPRHTGYDTNPDDGHNSLCTFILTVVSIFFIVITAPISLLMCIKIVQEYERAVIFRLGRILKGGARGPGLFFIIPCIDNYTKVDLRTVSFDVPPQEILTRDSVTVAVDAVVYYRIQHATIAVTNVEDYGRSTRLLAATTLRNVLGTKDLAQILSERESISHIMQISLDDATDSWGVKVERVEIKDVRLPVQMQRAMAAEAEASREARAKVIGADGEKQAARSLKEAADIISESKGALQLRYLQTLTSIAAEKNSTIVFPLPLELFRGVLQGENLLGSIFGEQTNNLTTAGQAPPEVLIHRSVDDPHQSVEAVASS